MATKKNLNPVPVAAPNLSGGFRDAVTGQTIDKPQTAAVAEIEVDNILADDGGWANGGEQRNTTVERIGSTSGRESNYQLTFDKNGGMINVSPYEFGIAEPHQHSSHDWDRLSIGNDNDRLKRWASVQYKLSLASHIRAKEATAIADALDPGERERLEGVVYHALRDAYGEDVDVTFTDSDTWDDITVIYNKIVGADHAEDGRLTIDTDTVMTELEADDMYESIREGGVWTVTYALRGEGIQL